MTEQVKDLINTVHPEGSRAEPSLCQMDLRQVGARKGQLEQIR